MLPSRDLKSVAEPMEVFRLNVKHEHIRQQLPEATGYFRDCILAQSGRCFYLVCFLLLH